MTSLSCQSSVQWPLRDNRWLRLFCITCPDVEKGLVVFWVTCIGCKFSCARDSTTAYFCNCSLAHFTWFYTPNVNGWERNFFVIGSVLSSVSFHLPTSLLPTAHPFLFPNCCVASFFCNHRFCSSPALLRGGNRVFSFLSLFFCLRCTIFVQVTLFI